MSSIQVQVDDSLKERAAEVAEQLGFDLPTAIRMFLRQMVTERALPFRPTADPFYCPENQDYLTKAYEDYKKGCRLVEHGLIRN